MDFRLDYAATIIGASAWAGRVTGLGDQHVEIAMMRTPDGHGRLELSRFLRPEIVADHRTSPVNALGYLRTMFTVGDVYLCMRFQIAQLVQPFTLIGQHRFGKSFQSVTITMHEDIGAAIFLEGLVRYQDLIAPSGRTKPCCQLHGRAEEIIVVFDWLTTIQPDADVNGLAVVAVVAMEFALDINGAVHGKWRGGEHGHDAITGVLDLPPRSSPKAATNQSVMRPDEFSRHAIAKAGRHFG